MTIYKSLIASVVLALAASSGWCEKDTRSPLDAYEGAVEGALLVCPMVLKLATLRGDYDSPETDWRGCITKHKLEIKQSYDVAVRTVKKVLARQALKEHYIAALSALTSIEPKSDEIQMNYSRRQAENSDKVTERWSRFEAEN